MAFVYPRKLKSGRIVWYMAYKNYKGKLIKFSTKQKTESAANNYLNNFNSGNIKRKIQAIDMKDLEKEVYNFIEDDHKPGTINIYKITFKYFLQICKNKPIVIYTESDILKFRKTLSSRISGTTTNIYLRTLRSIFSIAIKLKYLETNVTKAIPELKKKKKKLLAFTESEKELILSTMKDSVYKDAAIFAFHTGFRLNEVCNVQVKDIDLNKRMVKTYDKDNFELKTESSEREVPISDKLYSIILRNIRNKNNIHSINYDDKYLFENQNGKRFDKNKISRKFKSVLRELQFDERYHFHCTRHTFASELANKGVPVIQIASLLGQSSIEVTNMYMHSINSDLHSVVNKIA